MNIITGKHAISIFPRHTFIFNVTIVAAQGHAVTNDVSQSWLVDYHEAGFRRVRGGREVLHSLSTGKRSIGDSLCWVISFERMQKGEETLQYSVWKPESMSPFSVYGQKQEDLNGPVFEILDWRTKVPRDGSYLRVAEPFIWRSVRHTNEIIIPNVS